VQHYIYTALQHPNGCSSPNPPLVVIAEAQRLGFFIYAAPPVSPSENCSDYFGIGVIVSPPTPIGSSHSVKAIIALNMRETHPGHFPTN
jgi:hypothetical protein